MNGLSIIRNRLAFENNFTQIPNSWARDSRIGFRAKGILILLMSHSDGWMTSLEEIAKQSSDGISAIRTAVEQLEEHGYLVRTKGRDNSGRWTNAEWRLNDPFEPSLENPSTVKPQVDKPQVENQTLKKNNIKENQIEEKQNLLEVAQVAFEKFWETYPRKEGKGAAKAAYIKAVHKFGGNIHATIIDATRRYANNPNLPEKKFIPHPATWLNQERWLDEDLPQGDIKKTATDVARDIIERAKNLGKPEGQREIENGN